MYQYTARHLNPAEAGWIGKCADGWVSRVTTSARKRIRRRSNGTVPRR